MGQLYLTLEICNKQWRRKKFIGKTIDSSKYPTTGIFRFYLLLAYMPIIHSNKIMKEKRSFSLSLTMTL